MTSGAGSDEVQATLRRLERRLERERKARLEAEAIAEKGLRQLYVRQRQVDLVKTIATVANESRSVVDTLRFSIVQVCHFMGWSLGHVYLCAGPEDPLGLVPTDIWFGDDADRFPEFCSATERTRLPRGVGLPGRVLESGVPAWLADVTADPNFPRAEAARRCGLHAALAFPVLVGSEVAAVLEFFAVEAMDPDAETLGTMAQIGTQLGRVIERKRAEDRLTHDATHDALTGLANRALFLDRLRHAVASHRRNPSRGFAVLFIDLDRFKLVNDSLGHGAGDRLIVEVSDRLQASLRDQDTLARPGGGPVDTGQMPVSSPRSSPAPSANPADGQTTGNQEFVSRAERPRQAVNFEIGTLARLGGDEFTVLLDDIRDPSDAVRIAERIQQALRRPCMIDDQELYVTASIGVASSATGYAAAEEVLRDADLAMYRAKASGRARTEIYDQSMHRLAVQRLSIESDLRRALQSEEFVLHYQPIVSLATQQVVGFEALVRWQKRSGELVPPKDFIEVAEETGLIVFLGNWVLREACRTLRRWQQEFPREKPLTMSVNISARQFVQPDLVQQVQTAMEESGILANTLRLEITETVTMSDSERTVRVLSELRTLGVRLAIDDFGTGYSSLSYLHRFPLDVLKIDRSFVIDMDRSGESQKIVQTILDLAENLGMDVVAEGAELAAHVDRLNAMGCKFGQGYFFSRPLDGASARSLLGTPSPRAEAETGMATELGLVGDV
ncbi:MAG: GGDEF domain-containing protein [Acidisphaera sp.]|nr:GGDEF domain-containing protein [Acidisphaera sp.]